MPRTLVVWSARPSQPLMRMLVRPRRAGARQHRRQVAGAEADQRVVGVERRHDHLADLAVGAPGRRCRGARSRRSRLRRRTSPSRAVGLVGDEAEVGGARSSGRRRCRARASQSRSAGGTRLAADAAPCAATAARCRSRRPSRAGCAGSSACRRRPSGRSSAIACSCSSVWPVPPGNTVQPSACAPLSIIEPAGRQVVAEAVVDQVAGAKAGGEQGARHAPVVGARGPRARRSARATRTRAALRGGRARQPTARSRRTDRGASRVLQRSSSSRLRVPAARRALRAT